MIVFSSEYSFLKGYCLGRQLHKSVKALSFMYSVHEGQLRNDGIPYYEHPVKVANYLVELDLFKELDRVDDLVCSAILHDVIEDTRTGYADIEEQFGTEVAKCVRTLSKDSKTDIKKYFKDIQDNQLATLVKCSDRVHNVSTMLGTFKIERLQKYVTETETYVLPLMKHLRESFPEIGGKMCVMSYHMKSVLRGVQEYLKLIPKEV